MQCRERAAADKSRESGTADTSRESGTADTHSQNLKESELESSRSQNVQHLTPAAQPIILQDESQTHYFAQQLARTLQVSFAGRSSAWMIYLRGELGAGKSSFARACLRALGVSGAIKSPTYTLIESYPDRCDASAHGRNESRQERHGRNESAFLHMDLYRVVDPGELEFFGLPQLLSAAKLALVEWPERGGSALPEAELVLHFCYPAQLSADPNEDQQRLLWLEPLTPAAEKLLLFDLGA